MKTSFFKIALFFLVAIMSGCSEDPANVYEPDVNFVPETDITAQLSSYMTNGDDVNLGVGTYYVSESLIIEGFCGMVQGHPGGLTRIEVMEGFKASTDPSLNMPDKQLTEIFAVYNAACDITFQNIIFDIKGDAPGESHTNPWLGTVTTIDNVIVITGAEGAELKVTFKNIQVFGEESSASGAVAGKNVVWPLIVVGPANNNAKVDMLIENCLINNSGNVAIEYWRTNGGFGEIRGNTIINCARGIWLGPGTTGTTVSIENNNFTDITGLALTNDGGASVCFMNNTLNGVAMDDNCPQ